MKALFTTLCILSAALGIVLAAPASAASPDDLVLFDPDTSEWHVLASDESTTRFTFGESGDTPLWGDWDCDGIDSAAVFRPGTRVLVVRGTAGAGEEMYEFGVPGSVPLAGDWNGDGCDTVSAYHEGRVFIVNGLGGEVEGDYYFGDFRDVPIAGDFDGDGVSSVGVFRRQSEGPGHIFILNSLETAPADVDYSFGTSDDYVLAGDWNGDGTDTLAVFRSKDAAFHLQLENAGDSGTSIRQFGESEWIPAGGFDGEPFAVKGRGLLLLMTVALVAVGGLIAYLSRQGAGNAAPTADQPDPPSLPTRQ